MRCDAQHCTFVVMEQSITVTQSRPSIDSLSFLTPGSKSKSTPEIRWGCYSNKAVPTSSYILERRPPDTGGNCDVVSTAKRACKNLSPVGIYAHPQNNSMLTSGAAPLMKPHRLRNPAPSPDVLVPTTRLALAQKSCSSHDVKYVHESGIFSFCARCLFRA